MVTVDGQDTRVYFQVEIGTNPGAGIPAWITAVSIFSPHALQCYQSVPGGRWDSNEVCWVYPATRETASALVRAFAWMGQVRRPLFVQLLNYGSIPGVAVLTHAAELPAVPKMATQPWPHQVEAYEYVRAHNDCILNIGMGGGKSKSVIDVICNNPDRRPVLIVAPLRVCTNVWVQQFKLHGSRDDIDVLVLGSNAGATGTKTQKAWRFLECCRQDGHQAVIVINYDSVWRSPFGNGARKGNGGLALETEWSLVVFDEVHKLKSPSGTASLFCARLAKVAGRRLGLTGTLMPHGADDVFAQFRAVAPHVFGGSLYQFRGRYEVVGGYGMHQHVAWRFQPTQPDGTPNIYYSSAIADEWNAKLASVCYVCPKEILDRSLPAILPDETLLVSLSPAERTMTTRLYDDYVRDKKAGEITILNALTRLLRLAMACNGHIKNDRGETILIGTSKEEALAEFLGDLPPDEPVVVFCRFRADLVAIHRAASTADRKSLELSGSRDELAQWQNGAATVLAVQIQAGGVGVDMTRAAYCVYYSKDYNAGNYEQSRARLHRTGQTRPVHVYHLTAEHTIDEAINTVLTTRITDVAAIIKVVDEWGRREAAEAKLDTLTLADLYSDQD